MSGATAGGSLLIIAIVALLTFGARLFPFAVFGRGGRTLHPMITYIGNALPPAVMIMLVVYCMKDVKPLEWPHGIPEAVSVAVVVGLYKLTGNNLVAMVGGTALYMALVQVVFA